MNRTERRLITSVIDSLERLATAIVARVDSKTRREFAITLRLNNELLRRIVDGDAKED